MPQASATRDTVSIKVRDADATDLPTLIEVACKAYRPDPLINYFVRSDSRQSDGLRRLFDLCLREQALPHGKVTMTRDGSACAAWLPPAQARQTTPLVEQIALLPRMTRICSLARVPRLLATMRVLERHHPAAPHHYLYLLAVLPERQGQGLGSALLQEGLRRIDRARAATYLETASERNLALYERHGFAVTGEARLPFDGLTVWFLWREPAG